MNFIIQNIIVFVFLYKYVALFLISVIAASIIPIPSGSVLMAASAFASEGYLNFWVIIIISIIANILGDNISYWMARFYGEKIFSKIGFRRIIKSKTFNLIEKKFREKPGLIILASRFEVISTLSVNLLSGIGKVKYKKYLIHESIGSILQVCFYGSIGYLFGYNWQSANSIIGKILIVIALILLIIFLNFRSKITKRLRKNK